MEPFIINDYRTILDLYYQLSENLKGEKFLTIPELESSGIQHFEGLIAKIFFHAASALKLSEGTYLTGFSYPINFGDKASISVLVRAILETYAVFNFLFIDPKNNDQLKFRLAYSQYRGILSRRGAIPQTEEQKQQQKDDELWFEKIRQIIMSTQEFNNFTNNQKTQILAGKYQYPTKTDLIINTELGSQTGSVLYGFLSEYTHSGYLSLLQTAQADTNQKQQESIAASLIIISVILSLAIKALIKKFPKLQKVLDANPTNADLVELYSQNCKFFDQTSGTQP